MRDFFKKALNNPATIPTVVGVVALGVGGGIGYILGKRNASVTVIPAEEEPKSHDDPGQLKLDFTKAAYVEKSKEYDTVTDVDTVGSDGVPPVIITEEEYKKMLSKKYGPDYDVEAAFSDEEEPPFEPVTTHHTVFADNLPDWDYEEEKAKRTPREPYIIHADEFFENEHDYTQITITYYAGDDIMVDDKDVLIYNYEAVTGPLRFGHGSGDPNVMYIQSDKHKAQYEVLKHHGKYEVEVLGHTYQDEIDAEEIHHSSNRKFREE